MVRGAKNSALILAVSCSEFISKTRLEQPWGSSETQTVVTNQTHVIDVPAMSPSLSASGKDVVGHTDLGYQGTPKLIPCSGERIAYRKRI